MLFTFYLLLYTAICMLKVTWEFTSKVNPIDLGPAQRVAAALNQKHSDMLPDSGEISVKITTAQEVRKLNKKYAGKDTPTDVLSFNYGEHSALDSGPETLSSDLGDIVISAEHIIKQAKGAQTNQATELALLTLHGVLHILGYDHQTEEARSRVEGLQSSLMQAAGLDYRNFSWSE